MKSHETPPFCYAFPIGYPVFVHKPTTKPNVRRFASTGPPLRHRAFHRPGIYAEDGDVNRYARFLDNSLVSLHVFYGDSMVKYGDSNGDSNINYLIDG